MAFTVYTHPQEKDFTATLLSAKKRRHPGGRMAIAYSLVRVSILYRTFGCGAWASPSDLRQTCQVFHYKNGKPIVKSLRKIWIYTADGTGGVCKACLSLRLDKLDTTLDHRLCLVNHL